MISSSVALGCLPDAKGVMSWITPEAVNGMILDFALDTDAPERALNVVHPRPIEWSSMMGNVADELVRHGITKDRLPLVEMGEWFAKLSETSDGADEARLKQIVCAVASFLAHIWLTFS
jgi:NAD dependent epimerase/dehydratase family enzyme